MTSSNGNIFRVAGHLCREFPGHRWIPSTKASDAELWCFLWSAPEYNREAGDLRRHHTHYDVTVMCAWNTPVTGGIPHNGPAMLSLDVLFALSSNKLLTKQSCHRWFETLRCPHEDENEDKKTNWRWMYPSNVHLNQCWIVTNKAQRPLFTTCLKIDTLYSRKFLIYIRHIRQVVDQVILISYIAKEMLPNRQQAIIYICDGPAQRLNSLIPGNVGIILKRNLRTHVTD